MFSPIVDDTTTMSTTLKLTGKTRHGRNRIAQFGDRWTVIERRESVHCLDGLPGMLIEPVQETPTDAWRWVAETNDRDFTIEEL